jgi:hypothetical protein
VFLSKQRKWKEILNLYQNESKEFNNVNYATTMSQLLQRIRPLDRRDPLFLKFVDGLAAKVEVRGLEWIGVQGISNIAHEIGKMQLRTTSARRIVEFTSSTENAKIMVEEGNPQNVASVAWACVTLGFQSPRLFSEIERRASWLVEEGNPQNIANTAWAFATLGVQSPTLFSEIDRRAFWLVEEGNPQAVANTAWACATLDFQSPRLFSEIERRASWLAEDGKPQAVANTAWACATLDFQSPKLFSAIERRAYRLVEEGKSQGIAITTWACATLGVQSPTLFSEIERRVSWLVEEGKPQNVATTAWACATLGLQSPRLFSAFDRQASWLLSRKEMHNIFSTPLGPVRRWGCNRRGCFRQSIGGLLGFYRGRKCTTYFQHGLGIRHLGYATTPLLRMFVAAVWEDLGIKQRARHCQFMLCNCSLGSGTHIRTRILSTMVEGAELGPANTAWPVF